MRALYLIAIWIMIATERYADERLITLAHHFRAAHILSEADRPAFDAALTNADRRSASMSSPWTSWPLSNSCSRPASRY